MAHHLDFPATLAALCGSADPFALFGILLALLSVGFFGGFAHCGPMCGPFVLMQVADREAAAPMLRRLSAGLRPAYHLGRLTTYAGLGAVAGGLGGSFVALSHFRWAISALLALAAASFLFQALGAAARFLRLPFAVALGARLGDLIARAAQTISRGASGSYDGARGFLLGVVLGFLPCGFLYAALIAAVATGNALAGGLAMLAFGLGTVPALAAVGLLGAGLAQRWRRVAAAALPPVLLLNAATLGGIALHLAA